MVLMTLSYHAWDDGVTWVDQEKLAAENLLDTGTVSRAIKQLQDLGELQVRKAQRGRRRINVYRIMLAVEAVDYERMPFILDEPFDDHANCTVVEDATTMQIA